MTLEQVFSHKAFDTVRALDERDVTKMMPSLILNDCADATHELVGNYNFYKWLPEAFALFMVKGLSEDQKRNMISAIFVDLRRLNVKEVKLLSDINARVGRYGFSFPQWRFLTQGFSGPSLIEHYGLTRLQRSTDVRDPDLPKENPDRDKYGIGFVKKSEAWTLEYRRAYILIANHEPESRVALIIRNSSYFFGRDRLPFPVSVTWAPISGDDLRDINDNSFSSKRFVPWEDSLEDEIRLPIAQKLKRVKHALDYLDKHDMNMSLWLQRVGRRHVEAFIAHALEKRKDPSRPPFYAAWIDASLPPWYPFETLPAQTGLMNEVEEGMTPNTKLVFLSSPDGDLPLKPVPAPVSAPAAGFAAQFKP